MKFHGVILKIIFMYLEMLPIQITANHILHHFLISMLMVMSLPILMTIKAPRDMLMIMKKKLAEEERKIAEEEKNRKLKLEKLKKLKIRK